MNSNLLLGWATPVDAPILGARIETYCETKVTICAFKICLAKAPGTPSTSTKGIPHLPPEVVEIIAANVRGIAFDARIPHWEKIHACLSDTCRDSDPYGRSVLPHLACPEHTGEDPCPDVDKLFLLSDRDEIACTGCRSSLEDQIYEIHLDIIDKHVEKLRGPGDRPSEAGSFTRCKEVFAKEFGVDAHFVFLREYGNQDCPCTSMHERAYHTIAYLTTSTSTAPIDFNNDELVAAVAVMSILNPTILERPTSKKIEQLRRAIATLNLHVMAELPKKRKKAVRHEERGSHVGCEHGNMWDPTEFRSSQCNIDSISKTDDLSVANWPRLMAIMSQEFDLG